jgi:lysozyme family protein
MANVRKAIDFMLHQEDATLSGKITNGSHDKGGLTRFGLCAKWHPQLVEAGFYDPSMPVEKALPLAEATYFDEYAVPLRLRNLSSDAVACGIISFAVLDGIGSALKLLRSALYTCGYNLPVTSGPIDDGTFHAEDDCSEKQLVPALVQQQKLRCEHIAAADPTQQANIKGWNNRADQVLRLVALPPAA